MIVLVVCAELHAFKMLFYAESVGVVTSGHVTKMAVKPFDPKLPKTPCYSGVTRGAGGRTTPGDTLQWG